MSRAAESEGFIRLLTESQSRLYAYILTILPDFVAANEVLSDTNVTLWRKSAEFQIGTDFGAWAIRVAYFEILAYQKRRHSDRHVFCGELLEEMAQVAAAATDDVGQRRLALRGCLEKLAPPDRRLVTLRYMSGASVQEIAGQHNKSAGAVSQALYRIRTALAHCIERTLRMEANS